MEDDIKDATKELAEEAGIELDKRKNPFKNLHYSTEHLINYHEYSSLIGLYGRHYIPLIKARYYQLLGGILQKQIIFGQLFTDTRLHIAYPVVTEGGKNDLIYVNKQLIELGIEKDAGEIFKISEPISYSAESLVGKMLLRVVDNPRYLSGEVAKPKKIQARIANFGHLYNDFCEFDECTTLITSENPEIAQAREYLSKAENSLGRNKIEKRLVDDLPSETIAYFPKVTCSYYFQPFIQIPEASMLQGFMRRKIIPVGDINSFLNFADETMYNQKLEACNFSREEYQVKIIKHLDTMRKVLLNKEFLFTEKAKQAIINYALYISAQGQLHSPKIANYCKLTKFTSLSHLVKMSAIIASSYYKNEIDENCVALAFMDLVELMQNTFDFVHSKVQGNFDYGTSWGGANFKQRECLKTLFEVKAVSKESSKVTIDAFVKEVVCEVYQIKETQGRQRYLDMKKKGLIDSTQIGKDTSAVWLKINPDQHKEYVEGDKGYKGYDTYNLIFNTRNDILRTLKPLQPSKPLEDQKL